MSSASPAVVSNQPTGLNGSTIPSPAAAQKVRPVLFDVVACDWKLRLTAPLAETNAARMRIFFDATSAATVVAPDADAVAAARDGTRLAPVAPLATWLVSSATAS